jgi:hypothetical protein
MIRSNEGANCIAVNGGPVSSFRCLSVRSNECEGNTGNFRGLFYSTVSFTVSDSVISNNDCTYDIGGRGTLTFLHCYLDDFNFKKTGTPTVMTDACWANGQRLPA